MVVTIVSALHHRLPLWGWWCGGCAGCGLLPVTESASLKKLARILLFEGVWVLLVLADAISHLVTSSLCPVKAWGRWREFVLTMRQ